MPLGNGAVRLSLFERCVRQKEVRSQAQREGGRVREIWRLRLTEKESKGERWRLRLIEKESKREKKRERERERWRLRLTEKESKRE